ncbi:MAG: hypothetical protein A2163_00335 [Actinobacteria bacterium RBG_13_35_12]|nr:MAG: hypothetical protein A2163_00335 [Actinobacteria bacterium RBG_13_35_12]
MLNINQSEEELAFIKAGQIRPERCRDCGRFIGVRDKGEVIGICMEGQRDKQVEIPRKRCIVASRMIGVDNKGRQVEARFVSLEETRVLVTRPQIFNGLDSPPDYCSADHYWNVVEARKFYSSR